MNSSIDGPLYALVREVISGRIGVLSGQLSRERNRPDRNDALCAEIRESVAQLFVEREALSSIDRAALEKRSASMRGLLQVQKKLSLRSPTFIGDQRMNCTESHSLWYVLIAIGRQDIGMAAYDPKRTSEGCPSL